MKDILEDSKKWICTNNIYRDANRWEGELEHHLFNQKILDSAMKYQNEYQYHSNGYLIGLELEFYMEIEKINSFIEDLITGIPKEKMIIEDINNVLLSDGQQFFLIKDRTGIPPDGFSSLELITPIIDSKMVPYYLHLFTKTLIKYESISDENIGLHIHVSTKNSKNLSPISILYFLNQNNVFNWEERKFVRNIINQFFSYPETEWRYIYEQIIRKCYSINFFEFHNNNRLEYRAPGGKGYIKKGEEILSSFFAILKSFEDTFTTSNEDTLILIKKNFKHKNCIVKISKLSLEELNKIEIKDLWIN